MTELEQNTAPTNREVNQEANQQQAGQPATSQMMSHLKELRSRFIKIFVAFIVVFICLMPFSEHIYAFVATPLVAELPKNATMISINPTGSFVSIIKVTLYVTLLVVIPFILHQIWAFVAPGLYEKEKKLALPILISSIILFYSGVAFAYTLLTNVLGFLINFAPENVVAMPDVESYLDFVLHIFIAFGAAFEIPILTLLLVLSGIVKVAWLEDKRRFIIVGCFGIAAVVTPPDGWSMIMLAVPMYLLFELGLIMSKLLQKHARDGQKDLETQADKDCAQ